MAAPLARNPTSVWRPQLAYIRVSRERILLWWCC
jgi:hypothetical protein